MSFDPSGAEGAFQRYEIQGRAVTLPVEVRDATSATATYLVSASAARRLLPGDAIDVVELLPGKALLSIAVIDYRDNDLGDYNEVSLAFFVRERDEPAGLLRTARALFRNDLKTYIYRLPVNQAFTCEAGRTIWGFPKTVEQIEIRASGEDRQTCVFHADGRHVFTFTVPRGGSRTLPDSTMETYTYIEGVPHRTRFTSGASGFGVRLGGAELELGDHPIADELRSLGLPKRAMLCTWMGHMHGRFEAAEKL
jgi:hypothetical protein